VRFKQDIQSWGPPPPPWWDRSCSMNIGRSIITMGSGSTGLFGAEGVGCEFGLGSENSNSWITCQFISLYLPVIMGADIVVDTSSACRFTSRSWGCGISERWLKYGILNFPTIQFTIVLLAVERQGRYRCSPHRLTDESQYQENLMWRVHYFVCGTVWNFVAENLKLRFHDFCWFYTRQLSKFYTRNNSLTQKHVNMKTFSVTAKRNNCQRSVVNLFSGELESEIFVFMSNNRGVFARSETRNNSVRKHVCTKCVNKNIFERQIVNKSVFTVLLRSSMRVMSKVGGR
jgi:hypothetical protein